MHIFLIFSLFLSLFVYRKTIAYFYLFIFRQSSYPLRDPRSLRLIDFRFEVKNSIINSPNVYPVSEMSEMSLPEIRIPVYLNFPIPEYRFT